MRKRHWRFDVSPKPCTKEDFLFFGLNLPYEWEHCIGGVPLAELRRSFIEDGAVQTFELIGHFVKSELDEFGKYIRFLQKSANDEYVELEAYRRKRNIATQHPEAAEKLGVDPWPGDACVTNQANTQTIGISTATYR